MRRALHYLLPWALGILFLPLAWALLKLPLSGESLTTASLQALPRSGVANPVTAVLLNFRAYDTLLEVGVLLLAVIAVWSLREGVLTELDASARPLLCPFLRLVVPVLILASGYLLWIGSTRPGGAFQGGALIGGALVLGISAGLLGWVPGDELKIRTGLVLGLTAFLAAAVVTLGMAGRLLFYREVSAGVWILVIETAALISIGLTLGALFLGGRPRMSSREGEGLDLDHE
jgi:multisubunit Na+/H+ antiporter MnhB subunit